MLKSALFIVIFSASLVLAFGAEPPPKKVATGANSGTFALEYKLTGIAKLRGANKVFLVRHEADGTDLQIHLKQGERFEDLEVLNVDFKLRTVRVRYRGSEGAMTFNSHGIKAITTVEEQGDEFVRVHKKFAEEHKRAHEERYRRARGPEATESASTNSQSSSSSP